MTAHTSTGFFLLLRRHLTSVLSSVARVTRVYVVAGVSTKQANLGSFGMSRGTLICYGVHPLSSRLCVTS
ncbi:hypothetical protein BDV98DRAFT_386345 [Pterulicium gracile]|uniref:Secreted protein n=1 Tax=Pterulicium gracile TaxID=1884261 RepID=A0A5C3QNU4_9AGAR|nr:hypothetical protein BDV98DRAFT_386345 [Pterula gracilis]